MTIEFLLVRSRILIVGVAALHMTAFVMPAQAQSPAMTNQGQSPAPAPVARRNPSPLAAAPKNAMAEVSGGDVSSSKLPYGSCPTAAPIGE